VEPSEKTREELSAKKFAITMRRNEAAHKLDIARDALENYEIARQSEYQYARPAPKQGAELKRTFEEKGRNVKLIDEELRAINEKLQDLENPNFGLQCR
jgi:hypothetical protein